MDPTATAPLSFFEIPVADLRRARAFYGALFGWEFAPGNLPDLAMIPNASPAGALNGRGEGHHPLVFFTVPDLAAGLAQVRDLGGEADEPREIPSGWFARCRDDQGTVFTLWQDR